MNVISRPFSRVSVTTVCITHRLVSTRQSEDLLSKTLCKLKKQKFKISAGLGVRLIQLQKKRYTCSCNSYLAIY